MIKQMISFSDLTLIKSDTLVKKSILPLLEKNQVVDAKVLKLISPSKAELLIMGQKVLANTSITLTKGDTLQLKMTEDGKLNIVKPTPHTQEQLNNVNTNSEKTFVSQTSDQNRFSGATLQFFAANPPFEGFTKLATTLFSNNTKLVTDKPLVDKHLVEKLLVEKPLVDKLLVEKPLVDKLLVDKLLVDKPLVDKPLVDKPLVDKPLVDKPLVDKPLVDKPLVDKADIKNILMSVALKSDKVDIDFLPQLLKKSGMMFEKKIFDMFKLSSNTSSISSDRNIESKFFDQLKSSTFFDQKAPLTDVESDLTNMAFHNTNTTPNTVLQANPSPTHLFTDQNLLNLKNIVQEDLKGAVLNLIANPESIESAEEIKVFNEFIKNLENVQLLNTHLSESGKYIIPFPVFSENQFSFGQLFFDLGQKENEDSSSKENSLLRVSLFLDMSCLGPIRADFSVLKKNITGGFQVSNDEIANFFKQMMPELKERLQIHDYNVHRIECKVVESAKLAEKSIINELLKSEDHGFSLMI